MHACMDEARAAELNIKWGMQALEKGKGVQGNLAVEYVRKLRTMLIELEAVWSKAMSMLKFKRLAGDWLQHEKRIQDRWVLSSSGQSKCGLYLIAPSFVFKIPVSLKIIELQAEQPNSDPAMFKTRVLPLHACFHRRWTS